MPSTSTLVIVGCVWMGIGLVVAVVIGRAIAERETTEIRNDEFIGQRIILWASFVVVAAAIALVVTGPEPCSDPYTTSCAVEYRSEP